MATVVVSSVLAGCSGKLQTEVDGNEPTFVVAETNVAGISHEGATLMLEYYVNNPVEDALITFDNSGVADWTGSVSASGGIITIEVLPNTGEESRTGELIAEYIYTWGDEDKSQTCSITLTQNAAPEEVPAIPFDVVVDSLSYDAVKLSVTPADPEMTYTVMAVEKENYDIYIGSEDMLFTTMINEYYNAAVSEGLTLAELFEKYSILKSGEAEVLLTGLSAETAYYAFAVGLSAYGEMLSDFVFTEFTTEAMPVVEAAFEFGEAVTEGGITTVTITPSDDEIYYYADYMAVNVFEESIMDWSSHAQETITASVNTYVNYGGYTVEGAVKAICAQGPSEVEAYFLTPDTDYYVYAFVVDLDGTVISDVYTTVFTTPAE